MVRKIAYIVLLGLAALLAAVATRPATITIARSAAIEATPERVFQLLENFRTWPQWFAPLQRRPHPRLTHGGRATGEGSTCEWHDRDGAGHLSMNKTEAWRSLTLEADIAAPVPQTGLSRIQLEPSSQGVVVTWTTTASHDVIGKVRSLFADPEEALGAEMARSLKGLKEIAEK